MKKSVHKTKGQAAVGVQRFVGRIHSVVSHPSSDIGFGNGANKFSDGLTTKRAVIGITPSFNCDCLNWHTNGDQTLALKSLMLSLHLSDKDIIGEGVLSLGCRKHGKNGGVVSLAVIPRQNNRHVNIHRITPNRYSAKPRFGLIREARLLLALSCG
ncbi:MAG TPA: hypothetical protein VIK28_10445 [Sedimentisphaerales bacterium]